MLSTLARECLEQENTPDSAIDQDHAVNSENKTPFMTAPLLRGKRPETQTLIEALAETWMHGADMDWSVLFADTNTQKVKLPTYAFQRQHYWPRSRSGSQDATAIGQVPIDHPLLGAAVALADERGWLFTGRVSLESFPWLADHVVLGSVLLPGTALLELAFYAGSRVGCPCFASSSWRRR